MLDLLGGARPGVRVNNWLVLQQAVGSAPASPAALLSRDADPALAGSGRS